MQDFSELLAGYIRERKIKTPDMAAACHINLSTLYKIISGKRKAASEKEALKIAEYLQLSSDESAEFLEAYNISKVGLNTYKRRKNVHKFLSDGMSIETGRQVDSCPYLSENEKNTKKINTFLSGKETILRAIAQSINEELASNKGFINLILPPTDHFLSFSKTLAAHYDLPCDIPVTHIFCMYSEGASLESNTGDNIISLGNLIPLHTMFSSYMCYYFYYNRTHSSEGRPMFPWLVMTSRSVFLLSTDRDQALFFEGEANILFFKHTFDQALASSYKLLKYWQPCNLGLAYDTGQTLTLTSSTKKRFAFQMIPGMTPFLTEGQIREYIQLPPDVNGEYAEMLTRKLISHAENTQSKSFDGKTTEIYSLEGIREFLRTGTFPGYQNQLIFRPLDPLDRIRVIRTLLNKFKLVNTLLLKESIGSLRHGYSLVAEDNFIYIQLLATNEFFLLNEHSLTAAFYDYFNSLDKSLYYTEAEAYRIINELISEYKLTLTR